MFENRIRDMFDFGLSPEVPTPPVGLGSHPILPTASLRDIYQSAAEQAARDHELDRLFNPDYYNDHGSGI